MHLGDFSFLSSTFSVESDKPVESIRFNALSATRLHVLLTLKREQMYGSMITHGQTRDLQNVQNVSHEEQFREEVKALPPETDLLIRDRSFSDRKENISDSRFSGNVTGKIGGAWVCGFA